MRAILSACALILGALAFLAFWGSDVAWDDKLLGLSVAWGIRLAVHGIAILFISLALLMRYWITPVSDAPTNLERIGAALATAGLVTVLPLFFVGVALLGAVTMVARGLVAVGVALVLGAVLFAVSYGSGVRLGFEDGPALSHIDKGLAGSSITLVAIGLCALGLTWLQWVSSNDTLDRPTRVGRSS